MLKVFSPPRLTAYGSKKGLIGGVALDLTTVDEDGVAWGFLRLKGGQGFAVGRRFTT